eukprot:Skav211860  [mRNA]  locus=scaffold1431:31774:32697:- [translate_table: standard]
MTGKQPPPPDVSADTCAGAAQRPLQVQTVLRPLHEDDVDAVTDLFNEFVEDHQRRCDEEITDEADWCTALGVPHGPNNRAKRILKTWLQHEAHSVVVAEDLQIGKVAGFVHLQTKQERGKMILAVEHLKVARTHEKRGIGRLLLEHAEKQASEMALNATSSLVMTLLCVASNGHAKKFYQKAGWELSRCKCGRCAEEWLRETSWVCPEIWRGDCDEDVKFCAMRKQIRYAHVDVRRPLSLQPEPMWTS